MSLTTRTPECNCPYCGHKFDRVSSIREPRAPRPGDFTLCIKCGLLMAFDQELRVRGLNLEDLKALKDPSLQDIVARTAAAIRHTQAAKN
jgi:hypothetical protein